MVAAYHSNHIVVKKLLSAKAKSMSATNTVTRLSLTVPHGSVSVVKLLLSAKANVKAKDK